MLQSFSLGRLPRIEFGAGCISVLPEIIMRFGQRVLIVTGNRSFPLSEHWENLKTALREKHCTWELLKICGEPTPEVIDRAVAKFGSHGFQVVVGIGGGSVIDAAKAIAGLLDVQHSVIDYLEGVGPERPYKGPSIPLIAVPTTAGTGSEATKNAVITRSGADGYKKSFRDDHLTPLYAIVDPELLAGCPPELIAANGMDAFTQLLESYVSSRFHPITATLAMSGLQLVAEGLLPWWRGEKGMNEGREKMAYAALLSGICLAHTGLGSVHGLAQPLGSFFQIPHGVVCGALVAAATRVNIEVIRRREPENQALKKYAAVGRLILGEQNVDDASSCNSLLDTLDEWTRIMKMPVLSDFGVCHSDHSRIVAHSRGSSMKTNPVLLTDDEIHQILLFASNR